MQEEEEERITHVTPPMVVFQARLQHDLRRAMQTRQASAIRALRTLMAALANAEAVPLPPSPDLASPTAPHQHIEPHQHEVPRRELTEPEIAAIVHNEITSLQNNLELLTTRGKIHEAKDLADQLQALQTYL